MNTIKLIDVIGKNFSIVPVVKKINGAKVKIKTYLDADAYAEITATIADTCFQDGVYRPEYREIVRKYVVLKYFTNIEVSDNMIKEIFKTAQCGTWFADIERTVLSLPVWSDIENTVDEMINYKLTVRKTSFDNLCDALSGLIADFSEYNSSETMETLKQITEKINIADNDELVEAISAHARKIVDEQKDVDKND